MTDLRHRLALLLAAESERALTAEERLEQMTRERDEARAQLAALAALAEREKLGELDEIEARANAATPGPWTYDEECGYVEVPPCGAIEFKPGWERSVHFLARVHNNHVEGEDGLGFDGAFIAAARTDVPALIARVRELDAECAALRALLVDAHRELATIEAITVSPSGVDGLIELVNRIGQKLESSK